MVSPNMSHDPLSTLRERVRRIERPTAMAHGVVPFGVAAIDRTLPGGGLVRGALHEILGDRRRRGGWRACRRLYRRRCRSRLDGGRHRAVVPPPAGSLRAGPCRLRARSSTARASPGAARCRDPVGDGGRAARPRRRGGGRRSRRAAGGGEPSLAARRGTFRCHRFGVAALARRRAGGARTQSAERRRDTLAHSGAAVAARRHSPLGLPASVFTRTHYSSFSRERRAVPGNSGVKQTMFKLAPRQL